MTTPRPRPELSRTDGITAARLTGTAQRHARAGRELTEDQIATAIAELLGIATEPYQPPRRGRPGRRRRLRLDPLEHAAGGLLGGWLHSDVSGWDGRAAAQLLIRAGADPKTVQAYAEDVCERRDREQGLSGIGNPQPPHR
ncbi:hypothetical protein [Nocardioides panzhihuensis]|uniref:Uncharacterized protein n=1 Tax=Nocardioides panzhihuensis TaxID=860243 RepID=A0A7Z0DTK4_9ACTN|nr:hypothetical protein [Nocardioides panzhihuensis]NYI81253.1 hypothetical protein [Nocardioides panzhihuensis]